MLSYQRCNSERQEHIQIDVYVDFHFAPHFHRDLEFFYVLEGELRATVNGRTECAAAGDYGLILGNQVHSFETPAHSRVLVCPFSGSYVGEFMQFIKGRQGERTVFPGTSALNAYVEECFLRDDAPDKLTCKAALYGLCAQYLCQVPLCESADGPDGPMHRLLKYLEAHYQEDITLRDASRAIGYSEDYLSRSFHRIAGMNFRRFLNQYRIDCACRLIRTQDGRLCDIALECGFQNVRCFNRAFREIMGKTPSQYRASGEEK